MDSVKEEQEMQEDEEVPDRDDVSDVDGLIVTARTIPDDSWIVYHFWFLCENSVTIKVVNLSIDTLSTI